MVALKNLLFNYREYVKVIRPEVLAACHVHMSLRVPGIFLGGLKLPCFSSVCVREERTDSHSSLTEIGNKER